jgi:CTP synthase (UTP-ammonia lyase)
VEFPESFDGVLNAIKFARENDIPFIGTCAGFQNTILEIA